MGIRTGTGVAVPLIASIVAVLAAAPATAIPTRGVDRLGVARASTIQGSPPAVPAVAAAELTNERPPRVVGVPRYTRTLRAGPGVWSVMPTRVSYRWYRGERPIPGATQRRYRLRHRDVGRRIRVRVTARRAGYQTADARSGAITARHRVGVRRVATYHIETRGNRAVSLERFAELAQETYDDPRGWRARGVEFRRVARGGTFTLVLSEARLVPSFSPQCSSTWSCRVGRYVIINQARWRSASPAWNDYGRSRRDYRHMVVNHETGHWLGRGHAGCPGTGARAPVMMQQSKGLGGCRANPWPTRTELRTRAVVTRGGGGFVVAE
ncbi:MAG: DUF3152 domain-containing protein [Nocardioides sp.]